VNSNQAGCWAGSELAGSDLTDSDPNSDPAAGVQPMAAMTRTLRLDYRQRSLQRKVQDGLRRQLDLLTLGGRLYAATQAAAGCCANRSPFPAASDGADDGSNGPPQRRPSRLCSCRATNLAAGTDRFAGCSICRRPKCDPNCKATTDWPANFPALFTSTRWPSTS